MALSRHHAGFSRPLNVEEIVKEASDFEFNENRPMQQWLRAAKMLLTEAAICEQDGNDQTAYLYIYRHCELILTKLPIHPDYRNPRFKQELALARKAVQKNLIKLEQWKPRINQEHQRYAKAMERRNAERKRIQEDLGQVEKRRASFDQARRRSRPSVDSAPASPTRVLNADEHREFAVNLAQQNIRRRGIPRQSIEPAGTLPPSTPIRRQGSEPRDHFDGDSQNIHEGVREAGRHLYSYKHQPSSVGETNSTPSSYQYPTVPQRERQMEWNTPSMHTNHQQYRDTQPPNLPAKEPLHEHQRPGYFARAPAIPPKQGYDTPSTATPSPPPEAGSTQPPARYTFKPTAFTESGSPLRTVLLPPDLRHSFMNLADANTVQNLETCGILAATVISNALFINHLIIPDQTSTSDTCDTTPDGDNALFDYCDAHNLLVCGWIHTHPTQSCFLSSRDLHTSSGYQVMLPEAIAIVCAPRHNPDWGIFRLTDPPGLGHVLDCTKPGIFHPHSEPNLYTDALRPGHVVEGPGLKFEVVDLRK